MRQASSELVLLMNGIDQNRRVVFSSHCENRLFGFLRNHVIEVMKQNLKLFPLLASAETFLDLGQLFFHESCDKPVLHGSYLDFVNNYYRICLISLEEYRYRHQFISCFGINILYFWIRKFDFQN